MKQYFALASLLVSVAVHANDIDPNNFEREHFSSSMTRAQVLAREHQPYLVGIDTDAAGRVVTDPTSTPRAEVAAETIEASRLGLNAWGGHDARMGTPSQEEEVHVAGEHAAGRAGPTG
jgi:hypothetical protein